MSKEIIAAVRELEEAKGIDGEVLLTALEDALLAAYKKTPAAVDHARVVLDRDSGDIHVHAILLDEEAFRAHPGVRYPDPEELEAAADEAQPETVEGEVAEPVEPEPIIDWDQFGPEQVAVSDVMEGDFGRIAAQTAKQVILQRIREAEREMMFAKYQGRVGDVVTGIVQQSDSRYTLVDLGGVEALLPGSEQVPGERYEHGARIKAVIIEVRSGTKGPQIVLSRRSEELIRELFELEVPEMRGEKIDIIPWNDEPARFVAKALAPARVREVLVDDENEQATVIVPDDQLALAIGREGQNARLATRLTGWRIDIKSESEFAEEEAEIAFSGGEGDDAVGGRCAAILGSGRRCPNSALPGSRYCGIPAHRELAAREEATA
jgi:N utilization substance protein A